MNLRPLAAALCLLAPLVAAEGGRRAVTHEDVWLMRRVGAPVPSPDGQRVVFPVTIPAYEAKAQTSDLWLAPVDGSAEPRQITHDKAAESGVAWSPDSTRIAFSAQRQGDEATQIYVIDLTAGGEARRITEVVTGARQPRWSPDGTKLLFVSEVHPGAADEEANRKAAQAVKDRKHTARVYDSFPVKYWDRWLDDRRGHLLVQEAKPGAKARDLLAGTKLVAEPGFGGRQGDAGEYLPAAWTPDGGAVVFVATTARHRGAYASVPAQLFQVDLQGGEPRALTRDGDSYDEPEFSEDGRTLRVALTPGGDGKTYHHNRVAVFPWPFEAARREVLSRELDLSVTRAVQAGDQLFLTAEDGHQVRLYAMPVGGRTARATGLPARGGFSGLGRAGRFLVANLDHAGQPPEVVRIDPAAGTVTALTRFNAGRLQPLDMAVPEHFTFRSREGRTIHNLIVRPPGFSPDRKYPLLVVIHGGPAPQFKDAWGIRWNYHLLASPGYVLLLTNYKGSSGYSEEFGQAIQGDPLRGPAEEILQGVDEALARYPFIDGARLAAAGASYGGHLANWLQATTTRFRCLISHAGLINLETQWATSDAVYPRELNNGGPVWEQGSVWREQNPVRLAGNHAKGTGWRTPVLLTVGDLDYRVPSNNTYEYWTYLQRLQVPSRLISFPDENHWILKGENSRFWFGEVHAWLARWLQ